MRSLITNDIPGASISSPTIGKRQFFQDRNNQHRNSYNPKYLYNYDPKQKSVRNPLQYAYIAQTSSPLQPKEAANIFTNQKPHVSSVPENQIGKNYNNNLQRDILDQQVAQQRLEKIQTSSSYTNELNLAQNQAADSYEKQHKLTQPNPITQQIIPKIQQRQAPPPLITKQQHSLSQYQLPTQPQIVNGAVQGNKSNNQFTQDQQQQMLSQSKSFNSNDQNSESQPPQLSYNNIRLQPTVVDNQQQANSQSQQQPMSYHHKSEVPTRYGLTYKTFKEEDRAGSPTARKFNQMKKLIQQDDSANPQVNLLGGKHDNKLYKNPEQEGSSRRQTQSLHQGVQFEDQAFRSGDINNHNNGYSINSMISQQTQTIENKNPVLETSPFYVQVKPEKILVIQDSNSQVRDQVFKFLTTRGVWDYEMFTLPGSCAGLIEKDEWGKHFSQFVNFLLNEYVITDIYVFSSMITPMIKHYKELDQLSINPKVIRDMHIKYLVQTKHWLETKLGINGVMVRCFLFDHKEHVEKVL